MDTAEGRVAAVPAHPSYNKLRFHPDQKTFSGIWTEYQPDCSALGKYVEADGKRMLPLAIQVHHAVCDGYHVGKFIELLQAGIDAFEA